MTDALTLGAAADVRIRWGLMIPMRDGVRLHAVLYQPDSCTVRAPAIFTLTPYIGQTYHDRGMYFAARGCAFLAVDVRGRGSSEGEFTPDAEGRDGYDVTEWLASQPYCNGKVAMWGGSYQGYVQWATAKEFPPHLATIVPVAAPYRGIDSPIRHNIFKPYTVQWLSMIAGRALQDKIAADQTYWNGEFRRWFESGTAFDQIDTFLGNPSPLLREWLSHPQAGPYWDRFNPTDAEYCGISIPVLTITGAYDGDQPGALMHYREHLRNNPAAIHYLVIGPWDHAGTRMPRAEVGGLKLGSASLVDLPGLHAAWYAWTMQDGPKPPFLQDNVAYYVTGLEQWRYASSLQEITARLQPLYLRSTSNPSDLYRSGSLVAEARPSAPDHYIYDPRDVSLAAIESTVEPNSLTDQRMLHVSGGRQLVYHSEPFEQDTEISGFVKLTVWLSIDQPDTDFQVSAYEIGIDGNAIQLTADTLRARYRCSLREQTLITSNEPLRYDFERFTFVSRRCAAGSRLRLIIGPINSIYSQKNYNSGGAVCEETMSDARVVTVRLFHDESHPSVLCVPLGQPIQS